MRTRASSSALFAVGSTLLVVVVVASVALSVILSRLQSAEETLQALEPRYARLLGLEGEHQRLQQALTQTSELLEGAAYPATLGGGRVGADLQQRLRVASESAGFVVVSSRIAAANRARGLRRDPVVVAARRLARQPRGHAARPAGVAPRGTFALAVGLLGRATRIP